MIAGTVTTPTSAAAKGCTFESTAHLVDIPDGPSVTLWDTAGLNEGDRGTVKAGLAIANLYKLIRDLKDGVSLLVYCVRGRITDSTIKNYEVFYDFCEGKVPIALVVTGLEEEEDREVWWKENKEAYEKGGMTFEGHACIVATKGKKKGGQFTYAKEYEESTATVRKMITDCQLKRPWWKETKTWLRATAKKLMRVFSSGASTDESKVLYKVLKDHAGFERKEAMEVAKEYELEKGKDPKVSVSRV